MRSAPRTVSRGFDRLLWAGPAQAIPQLTALPAYGYPADDAGSPRRSPRRSPRHGGWGAGAFAVALFAETFGASVAVYLLGSVLGVNLASGKREGRPWAASPARPGILPPSRGVALVAVARGRGEQG